MIKIIIIMKAKCYNS